MEEEGKRQRSQEERLMFPRVAEEYEITEAGQRFGIPRTTYYYWKKQLEQVGNRRMEEEGGMGGEGGFFSDNI